LAGADPTESRDCLEVEAAKNWKDIALRTTYFRAAVCTSGEAVIPAQALFEASANGGIKKNRGSYEPPTLRRQSTRYSAHGIHEYRGKFNPQIVRAIGNILNVRPGQSVLDPFCGSGTTLLEAAHIGWNAVGVEINPLGVEISNAKIASVHIPPRNLEENSHSLIARLSRKVKNITFDGPFSRETIKTVGGTKWADILPNLAYLRAWFSDSVLVQISAILREIGEIPDPRARLIFRVILSDILRGVSLQDVADLRIRRTKKPAENAPAIPSFLKALSYQTNTILKARRFLGKVRTRQAAVLGDTRSCASLARSLNENQLFDAAITSPPYVVALPYIDTQRLSLAALGLIASDDLRLTERSLIGNREITNAERKKLQQALTHNLDNLPPICISLCRKMNAALDKANDGFRRQNMPALTYQYCRDMGHMFSQAHGLLKPRAPFALVVGINKTILGGKEFVINTPELLASLAEQNGFIVDDLIELNTYHRFDIHQANSIRSEVLLILRA
jgi:site-specific DNA-methyltransferase (cytosine-N4-specific)